MAIARTGSIIGALSGSLGTVIFANTKQGLLVKHRPLKTNQNTHAQLTQRAQFQQCKTLWQDLSAAEYLRWRVLAEQLTRTNRLGVTSKRTPFSLFMLHNLNLLLAGSTLTRIPLVIEPAAPVSVTNVTFTAGGSYRMYITRADGVGAGWVYLYGSRPMRTTPSRSPYIWRFLGPKSFFGVDPVDIEAKWDPVLGPPAAGEFVHIKLSLIGTAGRRNPYSIFSTTFV